MSRWGTPVLQRWTLVIWNAVLILVIQRSPTCVTRRVLLHAIWVACGRAQYLKIVSQLPRCPIFLETDHFSTLFPRIRLLNRSLEGKRTALHSHFFLQAEVKQRHVILQHILKMFPDLSNSENDVWFKDCWEAWKTMEKPHTGMSLSSLHFQAGILFGFKTTSKPNVFTWNILVNLFLK